MAFERSREAATPAPDSGGQRAAPECATGRGGIRDGLRRVGYARGAAMVSPRVQAKLAAGTPGDSSEVEADRAAGRVLARLDAGAPGAGARAREPVRVQVGRSPASTLSASGGAGGRAVTPAQAEAVETARGSGRPLPDGVGGSMGKAFGADFGPVRVHTDPRAEDLCRTMGGARALTSGSDVFFGRGQFQPDSRGGKELLAHELAHTLQQGAAGRVSGWWGDAHEQITRAAGAGYLDRIGKEALDYVATRAGSIDATVRSSVNFAYGLGLKGGERKKYERKKYDPKEDRFAKQEDEKEAEGGPKAGPEQEVMQLQVPKREAPPPTESTGPEIDVEDREDRSGTGSQQQEPEESPFEKSRRERRELVARHGLNLGVKNELDVPQLRANKTRKRGKGDLGEGIKWGKLTESEQKHQMWDNLMFHVRWTRETKFHGEAGQYVNESAESINRMAVDDQTRKAAEKYRGGARREGLLQLSDAVHNAEDRGSHGEGRPYTGHDPRLTMPEKFDGTPNERFVPGWDCDNPSKNSGGRAMAEGYAREVFENFLFQVGATTSDKVRGTPKDPMERLKEGQGGVGKSRALRTGLEHALRFGIEKAGKAVPKKNEDVQAWVGNPEEYGQIKTRHPEAKLSSRPEDNMPAYNETAGKEVATLLLRELDEAAIVLGMQMARHKSGKKMEGGFKKLFWIGKHAEELAAIVRTKSGGEPKGPAAEVLRILDALQAKGPEWSRLASGKYYAPAGELKEFLQVEGPMLRVALTAVLGLADTEGGMTASPEPSTGPVVDTGGIRVQATQLMAEMATIARDLASGHVGPAEMEKKLNRYSLVAQWAGDLKSAIAGMPPGPEDDPQVGEQRKALMLLLGNLSGRAADWAKRASTSGTTRHAKREALKEEILRDAAMYDGLLGPAFRAAVGLGATPKVVETVVQESVEVPPPRSETQEPPRTVPVPPGPTETKETGPIEQAPTPETGQLPEPKQEGDRPVDLMAGARNAASRLLGAIHDIRNDLRSGLVGAADMERKLGRYTLLVKSAREALLAYQMLGPGSDPEEGKKEHEALEALAGLIDTAQEFARRAKEVSLRGHKALREDVLGFAERWAGFVSLLLEDRLVLYARLHVERSRK